MMTKPSLFLPLLSLAAMAVTPVVAQLPMTNGAEIWHGNGDPPMCCDEVMTCVEGYCNYDTTTTYVNLWFYAYYNVQCNQPGQRAGWCFDGMQTLTVPGGGGDPHFKTWSGEWFDFHGECDLELIHAPKFANGLGLEVQARTRGRLGYSYIESAAVRIGSDIMEVSSFGEYSLNGVSSVDLPQKLADYTVTLEKSNKKEHVFRIRLEDGEGKNQEALVIKTFKDMVTVDFDRSNSLDFGDSYGLLGSFGNGTRYARDGVTVLEDTVDFGNEWQVQPGVDGELFDVPRSPQFPMKCVMPEARLSSRRLSEGDVSEEAAQGACADLKDPDDRARCVFDVLATQDLEVAGAGAF